MNILSVLVENKEVIANIAIIAYLLLLGLAETIANSGGCMR